MKLIQVLVKIKRSICIFVLVSPIVILCTELNQFTKEGKESPIFIF